MIRPGTRALRPANPLAAVGAERNAGEVTPIPSRMRRVALAHRLKATKGSLWTIGVSLTRSCAGPTSRPARRDPPHRGARRPRHPHASNLQGTRIGPSVLVMADPRAEAHGRDAACKITRRWSTAATWTPPAQQAPSPRRPATGPV